MLDQGVKIDLKENAEKLATADEVNGELRLRKAVLESRLEQDAELLGETIFSISEIRGGIRVLNRSREAFDSERSLCFESLIRVSILKAVVLALF